MRFLSESRSATVSRQAAITLLLVVGLLAAFAYATYLSYWGGRSIRTAFAYQTAVVSSQRDSELLEVEQVERHATPAQLRPYEKLLASDLERIDKIASTPQERAPAFTFPASRHDYERLTAELLAREVAGETRFRATVVKNTQTRDLSNAMFLLLALLFALVGGRLRRALAEGRSLVQRLQNAFISRHRELPNVDLGKVLISSTRGSNVGGDTHDAFTLDQRYGMFLVADVSGKGIEAAVDTAFIKYSIRTLFSEQHDPGTILSKFARLYASSVENPETFVVMFLAVMDLHDGNVRYASAGHEPAWAVMGSRVTTLEPTGPIVGIEPQATYETRELCLSFGDLLVISTDGLTESRDSRGALLGADAVSRWLGELGGNAQALADAIVKRLRHRSRRITDDLAILVVRYAPVLAEDAHESVVLADTERINHASTETAGRSALALNDAGN